MASLMPAPLDGYFAAVNAHDADGIAACFADDAIVRDEGGDIVGCEAIRAWADATGRKYRHTVDTMSVDESADRTIVTARCRHLSRQPDRAAVSIQPCERGDRRTEDRMMAGRPREVGEEI